MRKAAIYARVSSEAQKKEKTIDSQILELKKQIREAGDVLVKEYTDEGYSGAQLDRPAMDALRNDLKTDIFETIYVLNTDRIAREVTYQMIIVAEVLKYKKQIIINGKDYIHNPENKFALTVLGAVAELERAKITERVVRGKALGLSKGLLPGCGHNVYGYNYVRKTHTREAGFTINEKEAETVRFIFNEFTTTDGSITILAQKLQEGDHITKTGNSCWHRSVITNILKNTAYMGIMYFNKMKVETEYANPLYGTVKTSTKYIQRSQPEWVSIPIPPIISKELFEKTKEHITKTIQVRPTVPSKIEQYSGLIFCGSCGKEYATTKRRCKRPLLRDPNNSYILIEYKCKSRLGKKVNRCPNKQISENVLEHKITAILKEKSIDLTDIKKITHFDNDRLTVQGIINGVEFKMEDNINNKDRHKTRLLIDAKLRPPKLEGRSYAGCSFILGYDHIRKSKTSQAKLVINERETYLVRDIFNRYTGKQRVSLREIAQHFTNEGYISKRGKNVWQGGTIMEVLKNPIYTGKRYFNKNKERSEWIEVEAPQIISKEVYEKAQNRFKENVVSRPQTKDQLLSGLITCGMCGDNYYGYKQMHKRPLTSNPANVYNTTGYRCKRASNRDDVIKSGVRCINTQIRSRLLENKTWDMINTELVSPKELKTKITNFDQLLLSQNDKKLDLAIQNYCFNLHAELQKSDDFEAQRELLLKYIKKLVLFNNKVILFGVIQISEINKLQFQIERNITGTDRSRWSRLFQKEL